MRTTLCFVLAFGLVVCMSCGGKSTDEPAVPSDTLSLVMQVRECARLYTAECEVHKMVMKDDPLRVKGTVFQHPFDVKVPIGERKIMIPLEVTLKAYIDFSGFSEKNVRRSGQRIVVILPDPKVVVASSRIDHEEVKQFVSLTRSDYTSAEMAEFTRQGEEEILAAVPQMGLLDMARENATRVLVPMRLLSPLIFHEFRLVLAGQPAPVFAVILLVLYLEPKHNQ